MIERSRQLQEDRLGQVTFGCRLDRLALKVHFARMVKLSGRTFGQKVARAAIAFALGAAAWTMPARADVVVHHTADGLQIEAKDSSIADILSALGVSIDPNLLEEVPLDKQVSGTFSGSLPQITAWILSGYDYVAQYGEEGSVEIVSIKESAHTGGGEAGTAETPERTASVPQENRQYILNHRQRRIMERRAQRRRAHQHQQQQQDEDQ